MSLKKRHEFHTVDAQRCPMDLSRHHFVAQAPFDARYHRHVAAMDFAVGRVLVIWFGLLRKTPAQAETPSLARFDLAEHAGFFDLLSLTRLPPWKRPLPAAGGLMLSAGLLEIGKMWTSLRRVSLLDRAASRTSVVVGWMLWMSAWGFRAPPPALTRQGRPR